MANIPNPMVEYDSIPAVEKAAGFQLLLPENTPVEKIFLIDGRTVHLVLPNGLTYRMAEGSEDISGDYRAYAETKPIVVGDYKGTARGFYGKIFSAIWTDGKYAFALYTPYGISDSCLADEVIGTLHTVDTTLPNPIVRYDYIFMAEYVVGFPILVSPKVHNSELLRNIFVIDDDLVELEYANGIIYRIAPGVRDISGTFKLFKHSEAFRVGNYHVLARGDNGLYYYITWTDGKFSFSLYCPHGINKTEIEQYISTLTQIN